MDGNEWQILHQTDLLRLELESDEEDRIASHEGLMAANRRRLADSHKSIVASWSSIEATQVLLNQSLATIQRTQDLISREGPVPFTLQSGDEPIPAQPVNSPGK